MACSKPLQRKIWTEVTMEAADACVLDESMAIREACRLYNVPIETLRRRVNGTVKCGCKPDPSIVLTDEEEVKLAIYLVEMADMGFGLSRDTVMHLAYRIVAKAERKHPFKDEKAGCAWFDGFQRRHPKLTIHSPQPLSYSRALRASTETINYFFGKLGALYGKLNLISKPMQIFNCDET